jgi:hypothetical protein
MKLKEENNIAEQEFKKWLDKHRIPYWYIQQDIDTFSHKLKDQFTKRPDFFVLTPNFGFILVDVKDKKSARKYEKFFISAEEVEKYMNLQRIFNLPLWYVISNDKYHYKTWFWIPITKVAKIGLIFKPKGRNKDCYSVPISEFIKVSDDDSLERFFVKILKCY